MSVSFNIRGYALSQGNKWKCAACGAYNARRVQVCDSCHKVRK